MITRREFERLRAEGYTHIPVASELAADLETPIGIYMKLANAPHSYLFESVSGGERWGRYSIIGLPCARRMEIRDRDVVLHHDDNAVELATHDDPLEAVDGFLREFRVPRPEGLPRFTGGLVGYFGYDAARYIEPRLAGGRKPDALGVPDVLLLVSREIVVFDNLRNCLYLVVHADAAEEGAYDRARARLDELAARLTAPVPTIPAAPAATLTEADFVSNFGREAFMRAVGKARRYIADGEAMQVVLSQCLSAPFAKHPLELYRVLRRLNPSPYMYYLDLGGFHVVGSSPEILVRMEDGELIVRPIAGTRPRGATPREDARLEAELLGDEKELAEHLMLIDLGRNDLGRVCATGSVRLTEKMVVERYSHVMHIVSHVVGRCADGNGALDALRATFPAGTVSGAPKVRAMELIDELEPAKRDVYSGAIGYLAWSGAMDTAIAIRTALVKDGRLHVQRAPGLCTTHDRKPNGKRR